MKEQAKRELEAAFPQIWIRPDGAFHLNDYYDDKSFAWSPILEAIDGSDDDLRLPRLRVREMRFSLSELRAIINYIEALQSPAPTSSTELRDAPPAASEESGGESALAEFMKREGAVKWGGGECPFLPGTRADLLFDDGQIITNSSVEIWSRVPANCNYWAGPKTSRHIVAYEVKSFMNQHDRSPTNPVSERAWIHFMSASGYSGGNGWSDEIDWTTVDLWEVRPEGPPEVLRAEYSTKTVGEFTRDLASVDALTSESGINPFAEPETRGGYQHVAGGEE